MRLVWSPLATERVVEIAGFVARDRPHAAERWVVDIFEASRRLARFPLSGRVVPEAGRPEVREMIHDSHRVIYRVSTDEVTVLTVRHVRQILPLEELEDRSRAGD